MREDLIQQFAALPRVIQEKVEQLVDEYEEDGELVGFVGYTEVKLTPKPTSLSFLDLPQGEDGTWAYNGGWSWIRVG